ncbi:uncharacterized protein LOC123526921, partial [Mercenaria mercenaria]|uniref:uncharacterized protein LOC123526921 n=1 Tax=Mercenaria mercenaria TaxID=6596 RepID=UPI00234E909D
MAGADRDKKEFKNWVRGATGLLYLQEGLQDVVSDKVLQCRDDSVQKLTSSPTVSLNQCNQCTALNLLPEHADLQNGCGKSKGKCKQHNPRNCFGSKPKGRRKCPNGICSKLYDAIVDKHCFEDPLWKNTDPSTWCSDRNGWSFAKCFQTTPSKGTSADTTDAAGLLSILLNNKSIQNWLACKDMKTYTTACPFYKARAIRNEILHSPKFELGEQTLNDYLDAFIKVLQDPKCLISDEGSKQAVAKLKQLQKNQINISWEDETKLFQMHKEALSELDERKFEALQEIDDRKVSVLSAVDSARRDATKEVDDSTKAVLSKVEEVGKEVKEDIEDTAKTALSGVKEAGKGAKQDLEDTTKSALSEIEEAGKGAIQDTEGTTKAALSGIEEAGKEAKQDIEHTTKTALSKIKEAEYDSIKEIRKQKHV